MVISSKKRSYFISSFLINLPVFSLNLFVEIRLKKISGSTKLLLTLEEMLPRFSHLVQYCL